MRYDKTVMLFLTTLLLLINLAGCAFSNDQEEVDVENSIEKEDENKEMVIGYADYPTYTSIEDIREQSELIIHGKVLSKKCSWMSLIIPDYKDDGYIDPEGDQEHEPELVTIYEVSIVDEYKKTESDKTIINVIMLGGETPEMIYKIDGSPGMIVGEEYVFFLTESSILENGFWLLNDTQSLYLVDGDKICKTNDEGFELSFAKLEDLKSRENSSKDVWQVCNTIEEAEKDVGFLFGLPWDIEGYIVIQIRTCNKKIIEVVYKDHEHEVFIRKARREDVGDKDISEDYSEYDHSVTEESEDVTAIGFHNDNNNSVKLLYFFDDYTWSVVAPKGFWGDSSYGFLKGGIFEVEELTLNSE